MKCENCGTKLKRGDSFCPECGAQVIKMRRPERKAISPSKTGGRGRKYRFPVLIAGAVLAAALGGFLAVKGSGIVSGFLEKKPEEILFVSDGGIYGVSLGESKRKAREYTDSFYDSDTKTPEHAQRLIFPTVSKDEKYRFFPEDYDDRTGTFTLCCQAGKKEPERIASGVRFYYVTGDNQIIYIEEDSLYVAKPGERGEKVDSDLALPDASAMYGLFNPEYNRGASLVISPNEEKMIWRTGSGWYGQDIGRKEEKVKLAAQDCLLSSYTENFDSLLFCGWSKPFDLYLSKDFEKAEKVAGDVAGLRNVDLEKGTFFYMDSENQLYFYDQGEEELIAKDCTGFFDGPELSPYVNNGFSRYYDDYTDLRNKSGDFSGVLLYQKVLSGEGEQKGAYFLYADGEEHDLGLEGWTIDRWLFDAQHDLLYLSGYEGEEEGAEPKLMYVDLSDRDAQAVEYVENAVLELVYDGNVYYLQDWNAGDGGDLYRNGEFVCDDVTEVWAVPGSGAVVAVTDYEREWGSVTGTLNLLPEDGGDEVEIGTDVHLGTIPFAAYGEDCIFMLSDYSIESESGDLLYYDGERTRTLERDVNAYFCDYEGEDLKVSLMGKTQWGYSWFSSNFVSVNMAIDQIENLSRED